MKRFRLLLLLTVLMSMVGVKALAYDAMVDGICYNFSGTNAEVTSDGAYTGSIVIPETVTYLGKTYTVTSIGNMAFFGCYELTKVTIPNTVTSIGNSAFNMCQYLTTVIIPNSVTSIGDDAFAMCNLTSLEIPSSVTSMGWDVFGYGSVEQLTVSCNIPSAPSADQSPFEDLSVSELIIGNGVTSIGDYAFSRLHGGTKSIYIPNSVTSIGKEAFSLIGGEECKLTINCNISSSGSPFEGSNFNELIIGDDVTSIGDGAFSGCSIKSITFGHSLTNIGVGAFQWHRELTSLNIPNTVTSIGSNAFSHCRNLTSVTFGNSLVSIGDEAFQDCIGLTSIDIPGSVTNIGDGAFGSCMGLTSIKVAADNTTYDSRDNCNALIETATNTLIQGCTNTVIPNSVTSIGDNAFYYCSGLTSIDIPNSVTSIGDNAFSYCSGLTSASIGNSVTTIGRCAFEGCNGLTSASIGNSVTSIGDYAFLYCNGLTSIELPNSVKTIGKEAFRFCEKMEHVILGNSVMSIGDGAFDVELMTLTVGMVTPIEISRYALGNRRYATLYVPFGSKAAYEAADYWSDFKRIIELANTTPIETETTIMAEVIGSEDLSDNVVDGIYYNVGDDSYDATDGSIVIGQTTNMGQIINKKPGSADMRDNFTGVVLDVAAGQGTIKVNAKTTGNAQLVVQIGNGTPMIATKTTKGDVEVSYDLEEDTYVYVYAIIGGSTARMTRAADDGEVRIYGITVSPTITGVSDVNYNETAVSRSFTLDGKPLAKPKKGLNIIVMSDGTVRKVIVK